MSNPLTQGQFRRGLILLVAGFGTMVLFGLCGFGRFGALIGAVVATVGVVLMRKLLQQPVVMGNHVVPARVARSLSLALWSVPAGLLLVAVLGGALGSFLLLVLMLGGLGLVLYTINASD